MANQQSCFYFAEKNVFFQIFQHNPDHFSDGLLRHPGCHQVLGSVSQLALARPTCLQDGQLRSWQGERIRWALKWGSIEPELIGNHFKVKKSLAILFSLHFLAISNNSTSYALFNTMIKPFKISLPGPQDILAKYAIEVMLLRVGSTVLYLSADFWILVTTLLT